MAHPLQALTREQLDFYRENGYLAIPKFWTTEEIDLMRAEITRLRATTLARNISTTGDGATKSSKRANFQLAPVTPHSEIFGAMSSAPKLAAVLSDLLSPPIMLVFDQVFISPRRSGAGTNWHQENAYYKISSAQGGLAVWTAVNHATRESGTIQVIPREFDKIVEHRRDMDTDHQIRAFPDMSRAVPIELEPGGAVFFNFQVLHGTGANSGEFDRIGVSFHVVSERHKHELNFAERGAFRTIVDTDGRPAGHGRESWSQLVARYTQS